MIKRFLRWLLLEDLAAAMSVGAKLKAADMQAQCDAMCQMAYAQGVSVGRNEALDAVQHEVDLRRGNCVEDEDVANARKAMVH